MQDQPIFNGGYIGDSIRDKYFSNLLHQETVEQQLERQIQSKGLQNNLLSLIGILAEEGQSMEDDLALLTK